MCIWCIYNYHNAIDIYLNIGMHFGMYEGCPKLDSAPNLKSVCCNFILQQCFGPCNFVKPYRQIWKPFFIHFLRKSKIKTSFAWRRKYATSKIPSLDINAKSFPSFKITLTFYFRKCLGQFFFFLDMYHASIFTISSFVF